MTSPRPIVCVIYAEATAAVVRAQVPPLLGAWRDAGRRTEAAVFTSPRALIFPADRTAHRSALTALRDAVGRPAMRWTHLPRDLALARLGRKLAEELAVRGESDAILLARQPRAVLVSLAARDAAKPRGGDLRVVLDLRGIRAEEYLMTLGKPENALSPDERRRLGVYRQQEAAACAGADGILCVSRPMVRLVAKRHGIAAERIGRSPMHARVVADAERFRAEARRELGIAETALLLVYSGTLAAWQMPDASALLARSLRVARPDARLLFLTPETGAARAAIARAGLEGALVRSVPQRDVERFLCAADYGLLLREDDPVNRVACPVKFGEYLACGVRPVLTSSVGDQSEVAMEKDLAVVVGLADPALAAKQVDLDAGRGGTIGAEGRAKRRAWAAETIAPAKIAARIAEFVDRL